MVSLRNDGASKGTFVVEGVWSEAAVRPRDDWGALFRRQERGRSEAVALDPGREQEVKLPVNIPRGGVSGALVVTVRQLPSGEEVGSRRLTVIVPPMVEIKPRPTVLYARDSRLAVQVTLNVAPETLKGAALEVGEAGFFRKALMRIEGIEGRQITVVLDVGGAPVGEHGIFATLTAGAPERISVTGTAKFEKIKGPMDPD